MHKQILLILWLCGSALCQAGQQRAAIVAAVDSPRVEATTASNTDKLVSSLQQQVKAAPLDGGRYDQLGAAYFQKARETGDIEYYALAEKTLARSIELSKDERSADPLVHMALVCMGEHRFAEALSYAEKAMATGSGNLQAFAVAGDAYTDMGDYDAAASAYGKLQTLGSVSSSPLLIAYMHDSRASYLDFIQGDKAGAIEKAKSAILAALQLNVAGENLAWLYFELGERTFQTGDLKGAEVAYEAGLEASSHHYRSLAGLAKVRAAQGRYEESAKLYDASIGVVPMPQYIAELGDVYLKLGRRADARLQYDLVEYIAYISKLNAELNNRELALFYADREIKLDEALRLAKAELAVRHDIYTWDTLAWVQYKNHQPVEAAKSVAEALKLGTVDPVLLFHAGMIYHSVGDDESARAALNQALAINPHFHPLYVEQAERTLTEISRAKAIRASNE